MTQLRVFSFGGGVQSTAALVLAAQGIIDFPTFLFANVGNDSEYPGTLRYVEEVAKPYAAAHGITLTDVTPTRHGAPTTLYKEVTGDTMGMTIPARAANGAPGRRSCTSNFKIRPIARITKALGASAGSPAILGLGISLDEIERMNTSSIAWHVFDYPLVDRRLTRDNCEQIIRDAGLPVPPKSACWFCPFLRPQRWREMQQREPNLFMNAVVFEQDIIAKQRAHGKKPLYLSRFGKPLADAFDGEQTMLDIDDTCESGFCMT